MQQEKRMLEQQLLETAHVSSMASNHSSSMEYTDDEEGGHHASHSDDISIQEVEALREENEAIMKVRLECTMDESVTPCCIVLSLNRMMLADSLCWLVLPVNVQTPAVRARSLTKHHRITHSMASSHAAS